MTTQPEIIIRVAAEGGGIRLLGAEIDGEWRFRRVVSDWTPELLNEPWSAHETNLVKGWDSAIELLDDYPWQLLAPIEVHPAFRTRVLALVRQRYAGSARKGQIGDWERVCGSES